VEYSFNQHIGVFKNIISKEWCDNAINSMKSLTKNFTKDVSNRKTYQAYNDVACSFIDNNHQQSHEFFDTFWKDAFPTYSDSCKLTSSYFENLYISDVKFQKTSPTEGYHMWHHEYSELYPFRWGVYTLYLNDIEEGGETEFLHQQTRISPSAGTLCIFPSGYTHIHRGNPPFKKNKYILTGWLEFYYNKDRPEGLNINAQFKAQHIHGRFH
tara:strand:- start:160 stop:795 length:636 start_codon:yes stop_codon:yes gene_type:complete